MSLDSLPVVLSYSGGPAGPGRRPRREQVSLIVIHTNEGGAAEPNSGAEGLAAYLAQPHPPDYPAYHVLVDGDSAVRTARDGDKVNGAGGVNERAFHVCLYATAAQSVEDWHDSYSTGEIRLAAELVREACDRFGIPRIHDPSLSRGVCGHVDVTAHHAESQGHTDPGPNFPWAEFMALVNGATEEDMFEQRDRDRLAALEGKVKDLHVFMGGDKDPATNLPWDQTIQQRISNLNARVGRVETRLNAKLDVILAAIEAKP